jgi:hypothetical protein
MDVKKVHSADIIAISKREIKDALVPACGRR